MRLDAAPSYLGFQSPLETREAPARKGLPAQKFPKSLLVLDMIADQVLAHRLGEAEQQKRFLKLLFAELELGRLAEEVRDALHGVLHDVVFDLELLRSGVVHLGIDAAEEELVGDFAEFPGYRDVHAANEVEVLLVVVVEDQQHRECCLTKGVSLLIEG